MNKQEGEICRLWPDFQTVFVVFGVLGSMTSPQRSELHSVLRPFNSFAAVQEREKEKSLTTVRQIFWGEDDFYFFQYCFDEKSELYFH